jgi:hypothetical protein
MGGGTVMRAAAKVATSGVINTGLRGGLPIVPPAAEHAVHHGSRPFTAAMVSSSSDGLPSVAAEVERTSWEMVDDWDFVDVRSSKPRVVFGPPPTLDETKSATSDLKEAIENIHFSSPHSAAIDGSFGAVSVLPLLNDESSETKTLQPSNKAAVSVSNHAITAFNLLSENPAAQSVVASIAADQNVWNAVLHNEAFLDYLQTCKNSAPSFDQNSEEVEDSDIPELNTSNNDHVTKEEQHGNAGDALKEFFENVKLTIADMVRNVGDFFQNIFGPSAANDEKSSSSIPMEKTLGASFMALAMMVIMVVLMKRA